MQFKASLVALVATLYMPQLIAAAAAPAHFVPGAYIVEFHEDQKDADFYSGLKTNSIKATPRMRFKNSLFNGASFRLPADADDTTVDKIFNMKQVKNIWPVRTYARPQAAIPVPIIDTPGAIIIENGRPLNKRGDLPFSPHVQGGVDKLQKQGMTGKGITIAVIDTGIDYKHEALGGCLGSGCKVTYGYDLVGDDYDGNNTPVPDNDPMDCDGHGTHVAGTIAADPKDKYVRGVAHGVKLHAYKVFGCPKNNKAGSASNDVLIDAYLKAAEKKPDIITASIGGASGWAEDPWAAVVQKIVTEKKIPCTISNGNDGSEGIFYASGAADAYDAIGIGSVNNINSPSVLTTAFYGDNKSFGFTPATDLKFGDVTLPVWIASGANELGCEPLADAPADLSKYLVVIKRGTCTFDIKVGNAVAKGAKNVMIYNNVPGTIAAAVTIPGVTVGMVPPEVGDAWKVAAKDGEVKVTFKSNAPVTITESVNDLNGGKMSGFTTWGPTNEAGIKPEVSSPGGNILSTYPRAKGSYAVLSGTSMACPYAAGVVALYMQEKGLRGGKVNPKRIAAALANTANPVKWNDGVTNTTFDFYAPVVQQGGGMVDAYKMVHTNLWTNKAVLQLNDTVRRKEVVSFTLHNEGKGGYFRLGHEGAAMAYTTPDNSKNPQMFPPDLTQDYAKVEFPGTGGRVYVRGGGSTKVRVRIGVPAAAKANAHRIPVYSGYITVTPDSGYGGNGKPEIRVPYAGIGTDLHKVQVTDRENGYPALTDNHNTTVTGDRIFTPSNLPGFKWRLSMGSAVVRVDIVAKDKKLNKERSVSDKVVGPLFGYPSLWNSRNASEADAQTTWDFTVHGKKVPAGQYKILYQALKLFGDRKKAHHYERWESEFFEVKY